MTRYPKPDFVRWHIFKKQEVLIKEFGFFSCRGLLMSVSTHGIQRAATLSTYGSGLLSRRRSRVQAVTVRRLTQLLARFPPGGAVSQLKQTLDSRSLTSWNVQRKECCNVCEANRDVTFNQDNVNPRWRVCVWCWGVCVRLIWGQGSVLLLATDRHRVIWVGDKMTITEFSRQRHEGEKLFSIPIS